MLTLYVLRGCPYCAKVLEAGKELGIDFTIKDIDDLGVEEQLVMRGGKSAAPYLIDSETGNEMYESDAIIAYLHQRFGKSSYTTD